MYPGVAAKVLRTSSAAGLQGDASYQLTDTHTLRAGFYGSGESIEIDNTSAVFPANSSGAQTSSSPFFITDNLNKGASLWGLYLQDEWRPIEKLTLNYGVR